MIKRLISQYRKTRQEQKELRDKLNKKYPIVYLYYGESIKRIDEDGVCFEYEHLDCFLADSELKISSFVRLTGEGVESGNLDIYAVSEDVVNGVKCKKYYVGDLQGAYFINTLDKFGYSGFMKLDEIINQIDWINRRAKDRAKEEAIFDIK